MRNAVFLVAGAILIAIAIIACTARDDSSADTTGDDTVDAGGSVRDSLQDTADTTPEDTNVSRPASPARRAAERSPDTAIPPADSIRAMRPKLPQVTPDSTPGRWRGLKLPERRPARPPIEPIDPPPDSATKSDSTPPRPPRDDR